jgi:hypothetical protein
LPNETGIADSGSIPALVQARNRSGEGSLGGLFRGYVNAIAWKELTTSSGPLSLKKHS